MSVKSRRTRIALQSSIEHQRSVKYLRPVCLQPDPQDGSFDYFACGGSGHWAEYSSEPSSDGIEVCGTSRKLLHAYGESPSAPDAAIGAANKPAAQSDHHTANNGTDGSHAAIPHANHANGIFTGRPNTQRASHPHVAGHPQDAATGQPSTNYDADSGHTATSNDAQRPGGVHPGQFSHTHPKAAGRFGTAGDTGPASAAQQCTQHSTTRRADNGRRTCTEHGLGPYRPLEAGQDTQLRPQSKPHAAPHSKRQTRRLASQDRSRSHTRPQHRRQSPIQKHRRDRRSRSHGARRSPSRPSVTKRLYLTEESGPRAGVSQSSQPPMETGGAPSVSHIGPDPGGRQPRHSSLHHSDRGRPATRTLSEIGSGSGIPDATFSELFRQEGSSC